jgi:cathepsin L
MFTSKLLFLVGAAFLCLAIIDYACALTEDEEWEYFKTTHVKTYQSDKHESKSRKNYFDRKQKIEQHNARFAQGKETFTQGHNRFSDLTEAELKSILNGHKPSNKPKRYASLKVKKGTTLPATVDWRTQGAVTPMQDQGYCGCCYTFSSTGALEGQIFLKTGKLVKLSEQNLIDCSASYGNNGCDGGAAENCFTYVSKNGLETESAYPYNQQTYNDYDYATDPFPESCTYSSKKNAVPSISGYKSVTPTESALQIAVATIGPIAIAIDASLQSFQNYKGGVYNDTACKNGNNDLDHAVLLVGYGTLNGIPYWLVKNSWNTGWGVEGYVYMARNQKNMCGVATDASYPVVTVNG